VVARTITIVVQLTHRMEGAAGTESLAWWASGRDSRCVGDCGANLYRATTNLQAVQLGDSLLCVLGISEAARTASE